MPIINFDTKRKSVTNNLIYYRPQRSWGKVKFSEACVKNSVHGGGGHMWQGGMHGRGAYVARGACMAGGMHGGGHAWQGGMHGRGHTWQGGMHGKGGVHGRVVCVVGGGMRGRYYEIRSMSGRYASYWNAFLFCIKIIVMILTFAVHSVLPVLRCLGTNRTLHSRQTKFETQ